MIGDESGRAASHAARNEVGALGAHGFANRGPDHDFTIVDQHTFHETDMP